MTFARPDGSAAWGIVDGTEVVDCTSVAPTLRAALAAGSVPATIPSGPRVKLAGLTYLPPIPNPDKIICVGLNYLTHIKEGGRDVPTKPTIFTRWANTQIGHQQSLV